MTAHNTEEILKTLELRIERAKKALEGLDPSGDQKVYRSARKRLKRAQRRHKTWKQLADALEKKRQASRKPEAKKPEAGAKPEAAAEAGPETGAAEAPAAEEAGKPEGKPDAAAEPSPDSAAN